MRVYVSVYGTHPMGPVFSAVFASLEKDLTKRKNSRAYKDAKRHADTIERALDAMIHRDNGFNIP